MIIDNPALRKTYHRVGPCRWCRKNVELCAHHLFATGHNGGRRIDLPCNMISIGMEFQCPCHRSHHDGNEPTFEQLLAISAADHDCLQGDLEALIRLVHRMPKINEMSVERYTKIVGRELNFGARRLAMQELESFRHLLGTS